RSPSLRIRVGCVPSRHRLGRRLGAVHHLGGVPGDRQYRLRLALSDPGSRGVLRALPLPDARDASYQHLEADGGETRDLTSLATAVEKIEAPANLRCRGFFMSRIAGGLGGTRHYKVSMEGMAPRKRRRPKVVRS